MGSLLLHNGACPNSGVWGEVWERRGEGRSGERSGEGRCGRGVGYGVWKRRGVGGDKEVLVMEMWNKVVGRMKVWVKEGLGCVDKHSVAQMTVTIH